MKAITVLLVLTLLVSFAGFASAIYYSPSSYSQSYPSYTTGRSTGLMMKGGSWSGIFFPSAPVKKDRKGFDRARCGTYYWNVQDRRHCWGEWKEKGIILKGW